MLDGASQVSEHEETAYHRDMDGFYKSLKETTAALDDAGVHYSMEFRVQQNRLRENKLQIECRIEYAITTAKDFTQIKRVILWTPEL